MIISWYQSHGYNFVALSDHNVLSEGEKWKEISNTPLRQQRLNEYLKKYGEKWVNRQSDSTGKISVRLKTLAEYRPLFEKEGEFLLIQAEEISDKYNNKPIHLGAVNVHEAIKPQGGNSVAEVIQNNLNKVNEQRAKTGQPMFPHLNHPNFGWGVSEEDMQNLNGERFFEVFNGHPSVHNYGDDHRPGTEQMWDRLLVHYLKAGKPLLYGLATDDAHNYLEHKVGLSNPGRGWVMVRAKQLTPAALIEAMEKGDFYATTGVELHEIFFKKGTLTVFVKPEAGVQYTIQFWGAKKTGGDAMLLKQVDGQKAAYQLRKEDYYVRAKIISSKPKENPYAKGDVETAWTQPVTGKRQ